MTTEFIARPSETPTLAHRAFVDAKTRCPYCGKREVVEIRYNADQQPYESIECLACTPWTTDANDVDESDPLFGIDLTPVPFCDEDGE